MTSVVKTTTNPDVRPKETRQPVIELTSSPDVRLKDISKPVEADFYNISVR